MLRFTFIFSFQRAFCRPAGAARPGAAPGAGLRAGPGRGRQRFASEVLPLREERRCVSSAVRRGGTGGAGAGLPGAGRCARGRWAAGGRGERGAVCQEENGVKHAEKPKLSLGGIEECALRC